MSQYLKLNKTLKWLQENTQDRLLAGKIGLEKESLRVDAAGSISQQSHPVALGAPLTHPYITTDFSEALCELVTPPFSSSAEALQFLQTTHQFVYRNLHSEILWATSMPCLVAGEISIPIADYGKSNEGLMKKVYRIGLGRRYGQVMQVIAGVHFNYSVCPEFWPIYQQYWQTSEPLQTFIDEHYFRLIRNLQRFGWLIPYLFGASPAVCKSFFDGKESDLQLFDESTFYEPYATSLRMGDFGYQNNKSKQTGFKADYSDLSAYIDSLEKAITTPFSRYQEIGVKEKGKPIQLNANILQIENEYYSTIRPKQILNAFEKPITALRKRGVQYVELRSLDVNAFEPMGVSQAQLNFLEAFLLFCLFHDSPKFNAQELLEIDKNEIITASMGREANLELSRNGEQITLQAWALELCEAMRPLCQLLDGDKKGGYMSSLAHQLKVIKTPDLTPSAKMLSEMRNTQGGFYHFARKQSQKHFRYFTELDINKNEMDHFYEMALASFQAKDRLEEKTAIPFDKYLNKYFSEA